MTTRPNFDLNKQSGVPEDHRRNRAITDIVEPGSTFKLVTTAAALTECSCSVSATCPNPVPGRSWSGCAGGRSTPAT